jgi:hypothetical protein
MAIDPKTVGKGTKLNFKVEEQKHNDDAHLPLLDLEVGVLTKRE